MRLQSPRSVQILVILGLALVPFYTLTLHAQSAHAAQVLPLSQAARQDDARAQDTPTNNVIVALAPISRTSPVELVALTLDANISETDGRTIVQGHSTFKVHNTDNADPITLTVGFPEWAGGALSFDPNQFSDFRVTMDNKRVLLTVTPGEVKIGSEKRTVNWYSFELDLDPDEKNVISVDFTQDLGTGIFPRFTYGLLPSTGWKGSITSARLSIHWPAPTQGDQFVALDPTIPKFDGESLTWLWTNFDPTADPGVTFIRNSLWNNLLVQRAATMQDDNSSAAHLALARIYQQLASVDTPRRDNFMGQAVAELETAARLDPKNVDAVSTLAQVYENRAGPASGPRDANYVALALTQWQNLVGTRLDGEARKHSAEDSFYLGIEARSREENEQALKFFTDAKNYAPQGAGPLYTPQHMQTETQAAHLSLARAFADGGQIAPALIHARQALGNDFDLSPAPPLPSFALDRALIATTAHERRIVLHLLAYPEVSDESKQAVAAVVDALNRTGAGSASLAAAENDFELSLEIPFDDDRDLENKFSKLALAFPQREDWNIPRATVASSAVEWTEQMDLFTRTVHYREEVDFASAQAPLQAKLNALSRAVGELESAPPDDKRAQLRLALLKDARQWWQRAMASTDVTLNLQASDGSTRQWSVKPGDKTTLTYDNETIRTEWYFIGAGGILAVLVLMVGLWSLIRGLRRRAPKRPAQ